MAWERGRGTGARWPESADVDYAPSGGTSPWERHPDTDELLYILEGRADVTILHDDGPVVTPVGAGRVIVVPRGL